MYKSNNVNLIKYFFNVDNPLLSLCCLSISVTKKNMATELIKLLAVTRIWRERKKEEKYMKMESGTKISLSPRHDKTCYLDRRACKLNLGNENPQLREEKRGQWCQSHAVCPSAEVYAHTSMENKGVDSEEKLQSLFFFEIYFLK